MKTCKCNVNNTDYKAILEATKSGDTKKIHDNAIAVAQKCVAELM